MDSNHRRVRKTPKGTQSAGWLSTIRGRLYLAFGFAAALTIIGSSVAFYEFTVIGLTTNEIVSRSLPTTAVSLRLAEQASSLVSSGPRLMAASTDKSRGEIMDNIGQQEKNLENGIAHLKTLGIAKAEDIDASRKALSERLHTLDQAISNRIIMSNERSYLASSVRAAHEALLIGLAPAIDDANFDLMMNAKQEGAAAIETRLEYLRRLLETESESNLLAGLLDGSIARQRCQPAGAIARPDRVLRNEKSSKNLNAISDRAQQQQAESAFTSNLARSERMMELLPRAHTSSTNSTKRKSHSMPRRPRRPSSRTPSMISSENRAASHKTISDYASGQIRSGQFISHRAFDRGRHRRGLGSMALCRAKRRAALGFPQRSHAPDRRWRLECRYSGQPWRRNRRDGPGTSVFPPGDCGCGERPPKESEQTRTLKSRRQLVETATQEFEQAVSNIVKTLDRAAAAMDSSARDMANSATRNQEQALATAAASEQATSKCRNRGDGR